MFVITTARIFAPYLTAEINMSRTVDNVHKVRLWCRLSRASIHVLVPQRDAAGLHGDLSLRLVGPAVHVADLACQSLRDDAVGHNQIVAHGRFAMVHLTTQQRERRR